MVAENPFEEPNLSYVRVNQNCNVKPPSSYDKISGTGESVKCHITKNMSPTDPLVVNAELLHKTMVDQVEPQAQPSFPLWTPVHLYASGERRLLLYAKDEWGEISQCESLHNSVSKPVGKTVVSQTKPTNKRRFDETTTDQNENPPKVPKTESDCETNIQQTLRRNTMLEKINKDLQDEVRVLKQKVELMSTIMKDPNRLSILMKHLHGQNRSQETKVTRAAVPCAQG